MSWTVTAQQQSPDVARRTLANLLPAKVPGDACEQDADTEGASPQRGGTGDDQHPCRSRHAPQNGPRLFDSLPGNHDDPSSCIETVRQRLNVRFGAMVAELSSRKPVISTQEPNRTTATTQ